MVYKNATRLKCANKPYNLFIQPVISACRSNGVNGIPAGDSEKFCNTVLLYLEPNL
jgi:hypothetical protein